LSFYNLTDRTKTNFYFVFYADLDYGQSFQTKKSGPSLKTVIFKVAYND